MLALVLASTAARAQSFETALPDPKKCVVVLEDLGNVGLRIGDAQMVADAAMTSLRKRAGQDGAMYEGAEKSSSQMKRLLGNSIEGGTPQDAQLGYWKACKEAAPWRVTAKFSLKSGKKQWIEIACFKASDRKSIVDKKRAEGETFVLARDKLVEELKTFCAPLPNISAIPVEPVPGARPTAPKVPPPWTPPPRRE